jgi:hypothetical protein
MCSGKQARNSGLDGIAAVRDRVWSIYPHECAEFMMDVPHDRQQMGSSVGLRHRPSQAENSCSRMSTWQRRIASSELIFQPVCPSRIPNAPPSPRSASDSAPANSTAPSSALHPAAPASRPKSRRSSSALSERILAGVTTASSEPCPILATLFPIGPWVTSFAGTGSLRRRNAAKLPPGAISSAPTSPSWQIPISLPLRCLPGESRYEILHCISRRPAIQWYTAIGSSTTKSKFERFFRAMGLLCTARMPVQAHSLW